MEMELFFYFSSPKELFWAILNVATEQNKKKIFEDSQYIMFTFCR